MRTIAGTLMQLIREAETATCHNRPIASIVFRTELQRQRFLDAVSLDVPIQHFSKRPDDVYHCTVAGIDIRFEGQP